MVRLCTAQPDEAYKSISCSCSLVAIASGKEIKDTGTVVDLLLLFFSGRRGPSSAPPRGWGLRAGSGGGCGVMCVD